MESGRAMEEAFLIDECSLLKQERNDGFLFHSLLCYLQVSKINDGVKKGYNLKVE